MPELTRDERGMVDLALLSQVVEGAFAGVLVTTVPVGSDKARIVYANHEVARMTGFSAEELVGQSPVVLLGFDEEPGRRRSMEEGLDRGEFPEGELACTRKDGERYVLHWRVGPVRDPDGALIYYVAFLRDVTVEAAERERLQEAQDRIAREHAYYRTLVEHSLDTMTLIDGEGKIRYESPSFGHFLGYDTGALVGVSAFDIVHADDLDAVASALSRATHDVGEGTTLVRARLRHRDGTWRWVEAVANNKLDDPSIAAIVVNLRDISHRVAAEEALRETEQRYRTLIEQLPAVTYIWEVDPQPGPDPLYYQSPQIVDLLGYTSAEWNEDPDGWMNIIHPDDREWVLEANARCEETGEPLLAEYRYLHKDGHSVWVHDEAILLNRRDDGRPWLFQGVMFDISERVAAHAALAESRDRFLALASHAPIGIFENDATGACIYVNARWSEIAGMPLGQALGDGWVEAVHPDDRERVAEGWRRAVATDTEFAIDYRYRRQDDDIRWVHVTATALRDGRGDVIGHTGTVDDITDRREMEEQLRLLRSGVEDTMLAVAITEPVAGHDEAAIVYVNPAFTDQTGYEPGEVIGRSTSILAGPETDPEAMARLWASLHDGLPFEGELLSYRRDGSTYVRKLAVSPIIGPEGEVTHWVSISSDVTRAREAEREVRESLEDLRRSDAERRASLVQLVEVQEQELGRMAEGVEDGSLQELTAVRLRLDMLKRSLSDPGQLEALDRFGSSVEQAVGRLRGLLTELRPRTLDSDGLEPAVREYLRRACDEGRISTFQVTGAPAREPLERERAAAYRIVQESLSAAVDNGASRVMVEFRDEGEGVAVRVTHDGNRVGQADEARIASMSERAELAGGRLSASLGLASVDLWVPLDHPL
jgi:PAS domain S-box-containing protein